MTSKRSGAIGPAGCPPTPPPHINPRSSLFSPPRHPPGIAAQFDWRRHWKKKVRPHLEDPAVQLSLDLGMAMLDPTWRRGDAPWALGRLEGQRPRPGCLSWYQPRGRCHCIAFFAMAVGVKNYPDLDWRFVSGHWHTVAVGHRGDEPRVVMDILNFCFLSAQASIGLARQQLEGDPGADSWRDIHETFVRAVVPVLKGRA